MLTFEMIDSELEKMTALLESWANINSHFENLEGIQQLLEIMQPAFNVLEADEMRIVDKRSLFLQKRALAPTQIYFGGHLDTVFSKNSPFQKVTEMDGHTLKGPGVADMKGGLVILLKTLELFESAETSSKVGWRIFINSDEESGSPYSTPFIKEYSAGCHLALLFEPTLSDGSFVCERKGSSNYTAYSYGIKGHAGRDAHAAQNAIYPLARFISKIEALNNLEKGNCINAGVLRGGEARNIIPDFAECHFNVRTDSLQEMQIIEKKLESSALECGIKLKKESERNPKPFDKNTQELFNLLRKCGLKLNLDVKWKKSGGVCDGNTVAFQGIPTIDTCGVDGGNIHTENEFMLIKSLAAKVKLLSLFLKEIV